MHAKELRNIKCPQVCFIILLCQPSSCSARSKGWPFTSVSIYIRINSQPFSVLHPIVPQELCAGCNVHGCPEVYVSSALRICNVFFADVTGTVEVPKPVGYGGIFGFNVHCVVCMILKLKVENEGNEFFSSTKGLVKWLGLTHALQRKLQSTCI